MSPANLGFHQEPNMRESVRQVACAGGAKSAEVVISIEKAKRELEWYHFVIVDDKTAADAASEAGAREVVGMQWFRQSIISGVQLPVSA
jgi:hypothetical protein